MGDPARLRRGNTGAVISTLYFSLFIMSDNQTSNIDIDTDLAFYIQDNLFSQWESDRQELLEDKWNRNLSAMKGEDWDKRDAFKKSESDETWKSHTYIPVTRNKVMSAYSIIIDMVMQGGRIPFMLTPSPWDNIVWDDLPTKMQDQLKENMKDMEDLIRQQLTESKADIALMQNIMSMAVYGETYAKRTISTVSRNSFAPVVEDGNLVGYEPVTKEYTIPNWDFVSVWDIFRDWENQDLKDGLGMIQRDFISPYELRQLKGKPYYDDEMIDEVLDAVDNVQNDEDSTSTDSLPPHLRDISSRKNTIRRLEFWGRAPRKKVEEYIAQRIDRINGGQKASEKFKKLYTADEENNGDEVEILCIVCNGKIIRFVPMKDVNDRPYMNAPWEIPMDTVASAGIADKLTELQAVLNGAMRTFEDNKKLTANSMYAIKEELLDTPLDEFKPGAKIRVSEECPDVRQAIMAIQFPDIGESLMSLIQLMNQYIEENSMVPRIAQGLQSTKDVTAFEISQQIQGSGKYNGGVTRNLDVYLIGPMVTEYYEYDMLDPNIPFEKGHYEVKPLGFTTYQNKIVRVQKMQQFLAIVSQDEDLKRKFDTGKMGEEIAKLMDVEVDQFRLTDDQLKIQQEREAIAAERADQLARMEIGVKKSEIDKDKAYAETQRINAQISLEELRMKQTEANTKTAAAENTAIINDLKSKGVPEEAIKIEDVPPGAELPVPQEPTNAGTEAT